MSANPIGKKDLFGEGPISQQTGKREPEQSASVASHISLHLERSGSLQTAGFSNHPYGSPVEPPTHEVDFPRRPIPNKYGSRQLLDEGECLLTAIEVARRLGVSERFVRDHTSRRSPKIRAVKLGPLLRFRWSDVETFLAALDTARTSRGGRFGV
jgi:excisionase family DNA binding protein